MYRLSWFHIYIKKQQETLSIKKINAFAVKVALNHEEIGKLPARITKIKRFTKKYIWEGINYPSDTNDWKKSEKNNLMIAVNVL